MTFKSAAMTFLMHRIRLVRLYVYCANTIMLSALTDELFQEPVLFSNYATVPLIFSYFILVI